nr:sensor histidine kinase [Amphibacillus cookii]
MIRIIITLVTGLLLVWAIYSAQNIADKITKPIDQLTLQAKEIAVGNYKVGDVKPSGATELKMLAKTFNQMKTNIDEAIIEMKEKGRMRERLKEMEFKSLQNQIQPHFLFNTLNVISRTAYIEGAEHTDKLIHALSGLFRHNIGDLKEQTTLLKEVESVKKYFQIQNARFGDRISFIADVDETALDLDIPPLTLQPLIENACIHGIESIEEGGFILLAVRDYSDHVLIEITDNGDGMDQQTVDQLLTFEGISRQVRGHSTRIGVKNVRERLKLFQIDHTFMIESTLGQGTTVSIRLNR